MAQPCPRIDPLRPPILGREQPGILKYGATCMPGTATAGGCSDAQKYWAVTIPWDKVVNEGWIASGGNRYWASQTPAVSSNPMATAILRLMSDVSRKHFYNAFVNWDDYRNWPMSRVLQHFQGKLTTQHGIVRVEIQPDPNETAEHFAKRGGYLLWIDPATGAFTSHQPLEWYHPVWLGSDFANVALWGYYNIATSMVEYSVRVTYKSDWNKAAQASTGWIAKATAGFCDLITSDKAQAGALAASMYYSVAPGYGAAWAEANRQCGFKNLPCEPRPDQPPVNPTIATGGWKSTMTASGASTGALLPYLNVNPTTSGAATPTPVYPVGTIAWYDPTLSIYRIASPFPGDGTTHAVIAPQAKLPAGVTLVGKTEWEKATLPFWRRTTTKYGTMAAGVAAAIAATVYVGASNR